MDRDAYCWILVGPVTVLPIASTVPVSGGGSVPVLEVMVAGPVTVLQSNSTPAMLYLSVTGPVMVLSEQGDELGLPPHPDTLSGWFDERVKESGLRRIRLHDCRHSTATLMLQNGVPVHVVSRHLRHSSVAITLDLYAHVLPGQSEDAVSALSEVLSGF